jgi:hypothetical protein
MTRGELEKLDRDALIDQAKKLGIKRAHILTRPELMDELIVRTVSDEEARGYSRGLFGRARDLLARLVEQGLHLPDAAERIRSVGRAFARPEVAGPLPTLTLAEIYAAQGYRARAIETLQGVLSVEPDHAAAQSLLAKLREAAGAASPRLPPEPEDPATGQGETVSDDDRPTAPTASRPLERESSAPHEASNTASPRAYSDADECITLSVDPGSVYVYWGVRVDTLSHLQGEHPGGALLLQIVAIEPTWTGPRTATRQEHVGTPSGELIARDLPLGGVVCAVIGFTTGSTFLPIAHADAVELPSRSVAPVADASQLATGEPHGAASGEMMARYRKAVHEKRVGARAPSLQISALGCAAGP